MRKCDDTCDSCYYIGEGDFYCDVIEEIVISDWIPVNGYCKLPEDEQED